MAEQILPTGTPTAAPELKRTWLSDNADLAVGLIDSTYSIAHQGRQPRIFRQSHEGEML
jgi:hypothetical protein